METRGRKEGEERLLVLKPEVWLGYNAAGDLVMMKKKFNGKWYKRTVALAGVTDFTVASWDKFGGTGAFSTWTETTDP